MSGEEDFTILQASLILFFAVCMHMLTTFIHEMGHAIPALIYSREKVRVYIGSYGDPKNSYQFKWGRIHFFMKFNSFEWGHGMCVYRPEKNNKMQSAIITLGGPLISLLFAFTALFIVIQFDLDKATWFILLLVCFSSFWDFVINMIPTKNPIKLFTGEEIQSDGYVLMKLFFSRKK